MDITKQELRVMMYLGQLFDQGMVNAPKNVFEVRSFLGLAKDREGFFYDSITSDSIIEKERKF
ncbi:reverse transcriptase [Gossypium australe]|uniref:Reverse transcriptase n=1 Tax=Gossypium australe TaxID=47621 RepID=A0A5B6VXS5_9ROSI|nr:reverse transcriptase [Gossypium australe]